MMCMHQLSTCACTALRKATRAVGRLYDEMLADSGLTTAQFSILRHLARAESLPLSRLADHLVMDRTTLYRALTPLLREGWVAVEASGRGKAKLARLTDSGRAAMLRAEPGWERAQERLIGAFGAEAWMALEWGLKGLTGIATERQ